MRFPIATAALATLIAASPATAFAQAAGSAASRGDSSPGGGSSSVSPLIIETVNTRHGHGTDRCHNRLMVIGSGSDVSYVYVECAENK